MSIERPSCLILGAGRLAFYGVKANVLEPIYQKDLCTNGSWLSESSSHTTLHCILAPSLNGNGRDNKNQSIDETEHKAPGIGHYPQRSQKHAWALENRAQTSGLIRKSDSEMKRS